MPAQPGEFWVADIPFTDGTAFKRRPILVLWLDGADLVAAAVTSAAPRSVTDVAVADWKGLSPLDDETCARLLGPEGASLDAARA